MSEFRPTDEELMQSVDWLGSPEAGLKLPAEFLSPVSDAIRLARKQANTIRELQERIGELEAEVEQDGKELEAGFRVRQHYLDQIEQLTADLTAERQRRESAEAALQDVLASGGNAARLAEQEGNPHADIPIGCHPYRRAAEHFSRHPSSSGSEPPSGSDNREKVAG